MPKVAGRMHLPPQPTETIKQRMLRPLSVRERVAVVVPAIVFGGLAVFMGIMGGKAEDAAEASHQQIVQLETGYRHEHPESRYHNQLEVDATTSVHFPMTAEELQDFQDLAVFTEKQANVRTDEATQWQEANGYSEATLDFAFWANAGVIAVGVRRAGQIAVA